MAVKGLHKIIYPFAPDQSGAVSVLYELGGMIIVCDAGGCAGNICGFDEPRWLGTKSAIFSAGLRDMDAILGRDDLMISKIAKAAKKIDAAFVAIVGTPVPATIATDYRALRRMAEKRTGLPVITVDTNGAQWYDSGIEKAYKALFEKFTQQSGNGVSAGRTIPGYIGVIGATPLDMGRTDSAALISEKLKRAGAKKVICYGSKIKPCCKKDEYSGASAASVSEADTCSIKGASSAISAASSAEAELGRELLCGNITAEKDILSSFEDAGLAERNVVVAVSGLRAARWLREHFCTPYECADPLIDEVWQTLAAEFARQQKTSDNIAVHFAEQKQMGSAKTAEADQQHNEKDGTFAEHDSSCALPRHEKISETFKCADSMLTEALAGKRILIIHQQIRANALRGMIRTKTGEPGRIKVGTWFMLEDEISEPGDLRIREESDFFDLTESKDYDVIIADGSLRRAAKGFEGLFIDLPHFAVSGKM